MKAKGVRATIFAFLAALTVLAIARPAVGSSAPDQSAPATRLSGHPERAANGARLARSYGKLPLHFEANRGQTDERVKFVARGSGYTLFLTAQEAVMSLRETRAGGAATGGATTGGVVPGVASTGIATLGGATPDEATPAGAQVNAAVPQMDGQRPKEHEQRVLRMRLVGGNSSPEVIGLDELPGKANYFLGSDPVKWHTNVPTYAKVRYENVYPGIDLVYYGNRQALEYDFIVAPGADPRAIRLAFEAADDVALGEDGNLILQMKGGKVTLKAPVAYQDVEGIRQAISGRYVVESDGQVGFQVTAYNRARTLVIDPVLVYSTYLGGSSADRGIAIAVDSSGSAYVTGYTESTNFPTVNPIHGDRGYADVFVTKLNPAGSALVYSTYLGGNYWDSGVALAVDSSGSAYLTGETESPNFPVVNPFQGTKAAGFDAFVAKLNPAGSALAYSTHLGGNADDRGRGIALDSSGSAYVTGLTTSTTFPTANPIQAANAGSYDAFVAKFNAAGSALTYSTYLGGSNNDYGAGIAVDSSDSPYVTGETESGNFPTANPIQGAAAGGGDVFVTNLNPAGSALVYSTYLGGSGEDRGHDIAVDSSGSAYVTGRTTSTNFPTVNPIQGTRGDYTDVFVTKLNPTGSALVYSTYLGGNGSDEGHGIAVDSSGSAYVTGFTAGTFPKAKQIQGDQGSWDAFVTKLDPAGSSLVVSTYLGGSLQDYGYGIAVDSFGSAYVTGETASATFPTTNPIQGANAGGFDVFVTKMELFCQVDLDCDDASACTTEECIPQDPGADAFGCVYSVVDCDDGNVCTDDGCNPSTGCEHIYNTAPCDDEEACTDSVCTDGVCVGTPDAGECLEHFVFYKTRASVGAARFVKFGPLRLTDQFGQADYDVLVPRQLGLPADKNGEGTEDAVTHLAEYKIKPVVGSTPFAGVTDISITNQCNNLLVEIKKPVSVLVPTSKDLIAPVPPPDPLLHDLDHFECYKAKAQKTLADGTKLAKFPKGIQVEILDQFAPAEVRRYDLKKIVKLCNPVDKAEEPGQPPILLSGPDKGTVKTIEPAAIRHAEAHLVCYRAKLAKRRIEQDGCGCDPDASPQCKGIEITQASVVAPSGVYVSNQFGWEQIDAIKEREICIPSLKALPAP